MPTSRRPNEPAKTDDVRPQVLVVDDDDAIRRTVRICLEGAGYAVHLAASGEEAVKTIKRTPPDLALVDLRLGGMDGIAVTRAIAQEAPATSIVLMTAYATIDSAVEAMRAGATDYLPKPFTPDQVKHLVARVLDGARIRQELADSRRHTRRTPQSSASPAVQEAYRMAELAAKSNATVLLLGKTGTGKGLLARHIHQISPRASRPFVTVNCATISANLIESELFGHARGAFTGADQARAGYVEAAKNGTLFIDEVGDLSKELQGKLLRILEEQEYVRIGDTEPRRSEARVIAATHRDLKTAVADGTFRDDLFYRLNVVSVRLPSLSERREDIPTLVASLLEHPSRSGPTLKTVSPAAMDALVAYEWPGNIRELSNVLERAVLLASGTTLTPDLLPEEVRTSAKARGGAPAGGACPGGTDDSGDESMEAAERRHIAAVLARHASLDAAARALGIDASTLYRKRERYGLR